jgi:hypothetical protein
LRKARSGVEVVGQSDAMSGYDFADFVLAVAVEGRPGYRRELVSPGEGERCLGMSDEELAACGCLLAC